MRQAAIALTVLLGLAVLADPYTRHLNASDAILPAPWWQVALGVADVVLLALVALFTIRRVHRLAFATISIELPFALASALILMLRDGLGRFVHGFGGEEYVSLYLLTILIRVLLLQLTRLLSVRSGLAAS